MQPSIREAVQPSLWDRLVDELHGLGAETAALRRELARKLGGDQAVGMLLAEGARSIERDESLDDETRRLAHRLAGLLRRQRRLEEGGVIVTPDLLREAVRRDIEMLFNIERLEADYLLSEREMTSTSSPGELLADYPEIRRSVLNYGVPSFSGRHGSDFDPDVLSRELTEVLRIFEPRLKGETIRVKVSTSDKTGLRIEIDALLMLTPVPERLRLSTMIDLDNGRAITSMEDR
ncbi:type VI secretion system baseplate subunit TssE [Paracoccus methylarcula]|uniref:Type VI secretion system baseplate subunit TssE n=1 Tax=Paracoccus methylarcula TaxID=72022 RepID=A0A3R7NZQ0_9RHOB|nr:GPW/gp25 family protein [Paracoccus methylarcula]RNF36388.1 type VI secretion system baseplate subunit TssE [Paracoccus methylarcula]